MSTRRTFIASSAALVGLPVGMSVPAVARRPAPALVPADDPVLALVERQRELTGETIEADRRMMAEPPGPSREEARTAFDAAEEAWQEIEEDIADTSAVSLAGILAKLRIVADARVFETDSALERMLDGAIADLDRLATV